MKKLMGYIDLVVRVVVIVATIFFGVRVLIYSPELWQIIFVLLGTPLSIYKIISYRERRI